jgi:hypothetical protein
MEDRDTRGRKKDLNPRVVAQSPGNAELSGSAAGWSCAWSIRGGGGRRDRGACGRSARGSVVVCIIVVRRGTARGRRAGTGPGLASITLLLLCDTVVVGEVPGLVVRMNRGGDGV